MRGVSLLTGSAAKMRGEFGFFPDLLLDIAQLVIPATAVAALLHPLQAAFGLALLLGTAQLAFDVNIARPGERIVRSCRWLARNGLRRSRGRLRVGNGRSGVRIARGLPISWLRGRLGHGSRRSVGLLRLRLWWLSLL